jgi:prepilin-type N-terminal cleavage/methylation domain-containing protein
MRTGTANQSGAERHLRAKQNFVPDLPRGKRRTAIKGLTLLEVVLATAIFSIIMVGTSGAWFMHQRAINSGSARTTASFLALQELNRCVATGYPNLPVITVTSPKMEFVNQQNGRSSKAVYQSTRTVQLDPVTKFKRVYVQVAWQEPRGAQSINYEVYLHPSNQGLSIAAPSTQPQQLQEATADY